MLGVVQMQIVKTTIIYWLVYANRVSLEILGSLVRLNALWIRTAPSLKLA